MGKKHNKDNFKPRINQAWRKQPKEAFKLGRTNRPVWGGSFATMQKQDWALLICCNGEIPKPTIHASPLALQLMPKLEIPATCPFICIDWADLDTPEARQSFWKSLVMGLQRLGRPGPIGVCCMGGTGRTGTALAIIAELSGAIPAGQCPVAFIRANYASDAIETREQGKYITAMTGATITTLIVGPYFYSQDRGEHVGSELKCTHGTPMRLFCGKCLEKSGGISKYERTTAPCSS